MTYTLEQTHEAMVRANIIWDTLSISDKALWRNECILKGYKKKYRSYYHYIIDRILTEEMLFKNGPLPLRKVGLIKDILVVAYRDLEVFAYIDVRFNIVNFLGQEIKKKVFSCGEFEIKEYDMELNETDDLGADFLCDDEGRLDLKGDIATIFCSNVFPDTYYEKYLKIILKPSFERKEILEYAESPLFRVAFQMRHEEGFIWFWF